MIHETDAIKLLRGEIWFVFTQEGIRQYIVDEKINFISIDMTLNMAASTVSSFTSIQLLSWLGVHCRNKHQNQKHYQKQFQANLFINNNRIEQYQNKMANASFSIKNYILKINTPYNHVNVKIQIGIVDVKITNIVEVTNICISHV